jgi:hypothetical protein
MQRISLCLSTFALAGTLLAASSRALAAQPEAAECFAGYRPTHVAPYEVDQVAGEGSYTALAGARVFIPAEKGLTAEWLNAQLLTRMAEHRAGTDCPLDLERVTVAVQSGGPGFWVTLASQNDKIAKELLRRAERLVSAQSGAN